MIKLTNDFPGEDYQLVTDRQEISFVLDILGISEARREWLNEHMGLLFVKQQDGEIVSVYCAEQSVPWLGINLYHIRFER